MEATKMPIGRWMDKKAVVHMHNGILLNYKKNEFIPFEAIWIDLEFIILSEVSQRQISLNPSWTHLEPLSHLPPHTIPLGHPSAPAPSILYHASNLDWRFISHMIVYMFQCHSLKSSHPHSLHSVQKIVLYICVSFAVSYTGLSLPSF